MPEKKIDEVLNRDSHRGYLNKLSPEEAQERKRRQQEFKKRYSQ